MRQQTAEVATPLVDPELLAAAEFGLPVRRVDAPISGELRPTQNGYEILVRRRDPVGRQQFTVAHELGHYLLDQVAGLSLDEQRRHHRSFERVCDEFAGRLLAPSPWIRREFEGAPLAFASVERLADATGLSYSAAVTTLNRELASWRAAFFVWTRPDAGHPWERRIRLVPPGFTRRVTAPSAPEAIEAACSTQLRSVVDLPIQLGRTHASARSDVLRRTTCLVALVDLTVPPRPLGC